MQNPTEDTDPRQWGQEPVGSDADDLLGELEESIPQGVPNSTQFSVDSPVSTGRRASDAIDTDLSSLDELLNASMDAKKVEDQYKSDREARKRGFVGMSKEEVDFCNSRMHAFEMAREWDADEAYAVFIQYECEHCGSVRHIFSRIMEHHQHRHVKTTQRWVTVTSTKLPTTPVMDAKYTPMCMDCIKEFEMSDDVLQMPWLDELIGGQDGRS